MSKCKELLANHGNGLTYCIGCCLCVMHDCGSLILVYCGFSLFFCVSVTTEVSYFALVGGCGSCPWKEKPPWRCSVAHTHTHTRLTALCPGLPRWAGTRKVKPVWILLKQETMSGIGISWAICKSASHSRQITTLVPHHTVFFTDRMPFLPPNQQHQSTEPVKENVPMVINLQTTCIWVDISVTNVSKSFTDKMAAKTGWHRYGMNLCHCHPIYCLQWLNTVVWMPGRASGLWKLSDILAWLSVSSKVHIACIWSGQCYCHFDTLIFSCLIKIQNSFTFLVLA